MLVGLAAVQISAFSIFLFEWLSPAGYDMKVTSISLMNLTAEAVTLEAMIGKNGWLEKQEFELLAVLISNAFLNSASKSNK